MRKILGKAALLAATGLVATAMISSAASAGTIVLTGNTSTSGYGGNTMTFTGSGVSVIASAYSLNGTALQKAYLGAYDQGLGVTDCATSSPYYCSGSSDSSHTIDNSGRDDFVLLQFSSNVIVTGLTFGYTSDVDFTYKAASTSTVYPTVFTLANYAAYTAAFPTVTNVNNNSNTPTFAGISGNLFLVGASFAANESNDSFKLKSITFTTAPVPEPATWAMMIGGLGLVGSSMRRRKTAVSFA